MKYDIIGSNMQHLKITLEEGEKIYADSGTLVSKDVNVVMTPRMAGGVVSALERKATGTTALLTEFEAKNGQGEVAVAGVFPGKVFQITLGEGESFVVEQHSFLAADTTVKYSIRMMNISAAVFGGVGFYLQELVGPGNIFLHIVGDVIIHNINDQHQTEVEPGHVAAFDPTVKYEVRFVDNARTAMFGGVGLFLATFKGQGRLITHSVSRFKLSSEIYADRPKQDNKQQ